MIKLKKIKFLNYCGYRDVEFDLTDISMADSVKNWFILFGPNGTGKSNFLHAVKILSAPWEIQSRMTLGTDPEELKQSNNSVFLRRFTYNPNYQPGYEAFSEKNNLYMEGVFTTDDGDKRVIIENNYDTKFCGVSLNELPKYLSDDGVEKDTVSAALYCDADNPMNYYKFQIKAGCAQEFLDFATTVYNFPCELPESSKVPAKVGDEVLIFYTDFVLHKGSTKVHYKRMSAGEKKIATLLATLFNTIYKNKSNENNILLIDNLELHIYWKRHMKLIEKLSEFFPREQIIATTHSPVIIKEMDKKYLCDLEEIVVNE